MKLYLDSLSTLSYLAEYRSEIFAEFAQDVVTKLFTSLFTNLNRLTTLLFCNANGIERNIPKRLNMKAVVYGASLNGEDIDKDNLLQYIIPKDLKDFGLIPEIIGRLPVLTHMQPLDWTTLRLILTEPKNAITKQYIRLFAMDDIKLTFSDGALDYIVDKAIEYKLGARGLRSLCEAVLTDAMFELPDSGQKSLKVSKAYVDKQLKKSKLQKLKAVS